MPGIRRVPCRPVDLTKEPKSELCVTLSLREFGGIVVCLEHKTTWCAKISNMLMPTSDIGHRACCHGCRSSVSSRFKVPVLRAENTTHVRASLFAWEQQSGKGIHEINNMASVDFGKR